MDGAWDEEKSKGESFVADGQTLRHVHVTTEMMGVHNGDGPQLLKLEGCDLKPTNKDVIWPVEWWTLTINAQKVPPSLVRLKFVKVLDTSRCSTGGYSLVPGCLFAIGKPLPPGPIALQHPIPPFPPLDAVDLNDPNWWQMRTEIFRQIHEKTPEEKAKIKAIIDRQVAELQQHIDYLSSIECYADSVIEHPRMWDFRDKEEHDLKLAQGNKAA